jgi:MerR family transcriptional regulator, redox-sensitive transcriptional activator SoxR
MSPIIGSGQDIGRGPARGHVRSYICADSQVEDEDRDLHDDVGQLAIGEVAERAGMTASRIRYYEARGVLPAPDRVAGKRRYTPDVLRRLAIIDAAQRVGFGLDEIRDLLGARDEPAHERLRRLAVAKLPELDELIERAASVRRLLEICSECDCESIDVCRIFDLTSTRVEV